MTQLEQELIKDFPMVPDIYKRWQKVQEVPKGPARFAAFYNLFGKGPATYNRWAKKDQVEVGK